MNTVNEMMVQGLNGSAKLWIGKDYTNFIVKDFDNLDLPFQGNIFDVLLLHLKKLYLIIYTSCSYYYF